MSSFRKSLKNLSAYEYSVFLLSLKLQTKGQIEEKLRRKKYSEEDISEAIQMLTDQHYLDDDRFAQNYFENLKKYKNYGYYGIKKKLIQRKIPVKLIEKALKTFTLKEEKEIAMRVMEKVKAKTPEQKVRALQSKGFRTDIIFKATKVNIEE